MHSKEKQPNYFQLWELRIRNLFLCVLKSKLVLHTVFLLCYNSSMYLADNITAHDNVKAYFVEIQIHKDPCHLEHSGLV